MTDEYDWLQGFFQPGSQADDDPDYDITAGLEDQSFQDVDSMDDVTFMYSQMRNSPTSRPSNQGSHGASHSTSRNEPHSNQMRQTDNAPKPESNGFQANHGLDFPDSLREYLSNPQLQHSAHPSMAHNSTNGSHINMNSSASIPEQGHSAAARDSTSGQRFSNSAQAAEETNTPVRRDQSGSSSSLRQPGSSPAHRVDQGRVTQPHYSDPYEEIQRRHQIIAMNPYQTHKFPPIPPVYFQNASRAGMGSNQPAAQTTSQGRSTIPAHQVSRPSPSTAQRDRQPAPPVRNTSDATPPVQGSSQGSSQARQWGSLPPSLLGTSHSKAASTEFAGKQNAHQAVHQARSQPTSVNPKFISGDTQGMNQNSLASRKVTGLHHDTHGGMFVHTNNHGKSAPSPFSQHQAQNHTNQQLHGSRQNGAAISPSVPTAQNASTVNRPPNASESAHKSDSSLPTVVPRAAQPRAENNPKMGPPQMQSQLTGPQQARRVHESDGRLASTRPAKVQRLDNGTRNPVASQKRAPRQLPPANTLWKHAPTPGEQAPQYHTGKLLKNRNDLVMRISATNAVKEVTFDPKTIARDILIASGKHPIEKPLNHHLDQLRRNFAKIDQQADLVTFRWDLVDAKQPKLLDTPSLQARPKAGVPKQAHGPSPVPQPVAMAPGSKSPPGSRPIGMGPAFGPPSYLTPRSDWATFPHLGSLGQQGPTHPDHGNFIRPNVASRETPRDPLPPRPTPSKIDARAPLNGSNSWRTSPFMPPISSGSLQTSNPKTSPRVHISTPQPPQPRPPPAPIVSIPPSPQRKSQKAQDPAKPPPEPKQSTPKSTPGGTSMRKSLQATPNTQPDSRKVSKTPDTTRLPAPLVVIPPSPEKMVEKKKPGRPPKSAASVVEVRVPPSKPPVNYQVFACLWEGCRAELHNLDVLRGHIVKIHVPHHLLCKWKGCENTTPMAAADMYAHVSNEHISKAAWKLGDGPAVPEHVEMTLDEPLKTAEPDAPKATMILPVDSTQIQAFSQVHGLKSEIEKAEAVLDAGRYWKQQIGPALDQDGRRLSTPPRQTRVNCEAVAFVSPN